MAADPRAWEYKIIPHRRGQSEATPPDLVAEADDIRANLARAGDDGWELVAVLGDLQDALLILKRPRSG